MAKFKVPIANGGGKVAILDTDQPGTAILGENVYYRFDDGSTVLVNPEDVLNGTPVKVVQQIIQAPGSSNVAGMDGGTFKAASYRLASRGTASTSTATQSFAGSEISYIVYTGSVAQYVIGAYAVAAGTNTYTATLAPVPTALTASSTFKITFTNANTGAATLNLNGLGAKAIQLNGVALTAGNIPAAATIDVLYDGTAFQLVGGAQRGPFDFVAFYPGLPTASVLVTRIPVARVITFPASLAGSYSNARVAATAQADFDLQKNGVSVGTIRFAASGTVATYVGVAGFATVAGDILSVIAPATPDATLADIGFCLTGTR